MRAAGLPAIVTVPALLFAVPAHAGSDEDAVRAVLDGMNGSYNRSDFGGFAAHLCADMREAEGFEAGWRESRRSDGPTRITVNSISVGGSPASSAIANVRFVAAHHDKTLDIEFLREGAQWKACRYHTGQAV
ncbi:transcriptional regulator [Mycobacterium sp. B14F4]|uniref:transcriptional regulator n=1 Tax=Mycobacterium sp. B14F4 TaxID=3153565 RepID=UPI00325D98CF